MENELLLEMNGVDKHFPGVHALKSVHFDLRNGEVHALLGENGAGKSTLIKVLGGIYQKDAGTIKIDGKEVVINSVKTAQAVGVSIIHQEIVLVPDMTIAENLFLGKELGNNIKVNSQEMNRQTQRLLDDFGMRVRANEKIRNLTIAQQQMVEIIRATSNNSKIIVMDEPTSSLSDREVEALYDIIRKLKKRKCGIIYISHKMKEIEEIADRVSVFRDGEYITTKNVKETDLDTLVTLMVGRRIENYYTRDYVVSNEPVLEVKNLHNDKVHDVSFTLMKGEILGFSGLVGAGRSETMRAIFGRDKLTSGEIFLDGEHVRISNTQKAIALGIGFVPESRKEEGIFPRMTLRFNLTIKVLKEFICGLFVDSKKELEIVNKYMRRMSVKASSSLQQIVDLSGGNQQKVVLASWLATNPKVLILDEPTRGIDVGSKAEIYSIMNSLTQQGVSIIMISSELPEIINMSDRVVVMREGKVSAVLNKKEISQVNIMKFAVSIN